MEIKRRAAENRVLSKDARTSNNFFESDLIFRQYLEKFYSYEGRQYLHPRLEALGAAAAGPMNELSLLADQNGPQLIKRNALGETINEIRFHPAYGQLNKIAITSEMLRIKWEPQLRKQFAGEQHGLGFGAFYLFAMSELGLDCPLCMTDGAALLLDLYAEEEDRERLLPHIYSTDMVDFRSGCMFLTEKAGGSDVGQNLVSATHEEGVWYLLNGEKWFCSNANGEIIFTLARTQEEVVGTRGLSLFLVEKELADGSSNPIDMVRLKEKLGVRSMASAECIFTDTRAKLIGEEFNGFKLMADMVNLSRIHNALASVAGGRRALIEAFQFLSFRHTFGKRAVEHALIREKLAEIATLHIGQFHLLWRAIRAFDAALAGNEEEAQLLRLLTPMLKRSSAEAAVYIVRESMELMGGLGYIEDTVMPKLMRDVLVLPIWEGAGNIQLLDMLRAVKKSNGFQVLSNEIESLSEKSPAYGALIRSELLHLKEQFAQWHSQEQEEIELESKAFFEKLTLLFQAVLLIENGDAEWNKIALDRLEAAISGSEKGNIQPSIPIEKVVSLLAWEF